MTKCAHLFLVVAFVLTLGSVRGIADQISDTLTVTDALGLYSISTMMLSESQEPGKITINVPAMTVPIGVGEFQGNNSDVVTIGAFSVSLSSEAGPEPSVDVGESSVVKIGLSVTSGVVPNAPILSDRLSVSINGGAPTNYDIAENTNGDGPPAVSATITGFQARPLGGDGGDTFHMDDVTITLTSDSGAGPAPDPTEVWSDTITITAVSSPEPSTIGLFGAGLAGLLAFRRR